MNSKYFITTINNNVADEREDVQKKTFAKWINSQLLKVKDTSYSRSILSPLTCYHSITSSSFALKPVYAWNVTNTYLSHVFVSIFVICIIYDVINREILLRRKNARDGCLICLTFCRIITSRSAICSSIYEMEIVCYPSWKCSLLKLM